MIYVKNLFIHSYKINSSLKHAVNKLLVEESSLARFANSKANHFVLNYSNSAFNKNLVYKLILDFTENFEFSFEFVIYITRVTEYICEEILELSCNDACCQEKDFLTIFMIEKKLNDDDELKIMYERIKNVNLDKFEIKKRGFMSESTELIYQIKNMCVFNDIEIFENKYKNFISSSGIVPSEDIEFLKFSMSSEDEMDEEKTHHFTDKELEDYVDERIQNYLNNNEKRKKR